MDVKERRIYKLS